MESFWNWKWLMHANARGLFFIALFILLLVLGWCAWVVVWQPRRPMPVAVAQTAQPAAHEEQSIGILAFLGRELDAGAMVVPIDPFRPTLESLAANNQPVANAMQRTWHRGRGTNDDPFASIRMNRNVPVARNNQTPPAPNMRVPVLTYRGFFQRPDGKTAALFSDSSTQTAAFYLPGDAFHGVTLLASNGNRARVRLAGGEERELAIGETVQLPEEPQP